MAIDLKKGGRIRKRQRTSCETTDPYRKLLIQLYDYLARRATTKFNVKVHQRLMKSRTHRPPVGMKRLVRLMAEHPAKTAVVVGSVLDDERVYDVPKLSVCAMRVSEACRARIVKSGGEVLTFDQLAERDPKGERCVLLRGPATRKQNKHFGKAPVCKNGAKRKMKNKTTKGGHV
ncbi:MAG: uncharacterized protein KVP18_001418 [Porospora cf. gigantea A]|uniref:uncharacterized protein n=1 Tax=Porospora cf. gigantea A TaxID=2853593 RepID=UPI0035599A23|nr:MAG: hypothetical protein KVP18_001418 [Porospora cf. gigantea A]